MNRIDQTFSDLRQRGETALIPYITAGDPHLDVTRDLALALADHGADLIELGIPYSDPVADGPTIQRASERALAAGTTLNDIIKTTRSIRQKASLPICYMGYYNCLYRYGLQRFTESVAEAGVDGLIIPDLPPEEADELETYATAAGLHLIYFLAPTSHEARIKLVARQAKGFVYCVSVTGVTGVRQSLSTSLNPFLEKARSHVKTPIAVGFGISTPEHARDIASIADGAIVGSAFVDRMNAADTPEQGIKDVARHAALLKEALR